MTECSRWQLSWDRLGAFAEGRRHGEEALRRASLAARGVTLIGAHNCLGYLYLAKGTWSTPSWYLIRAWPSVVPLETGTICDRSRRAWAMPMRFRGASLRGARCWRRQSAKVSVRAGCKYSYRVTWLSEVWRLAGRDVEAWQHACQALDLARQHKERGNEALALYQLGSPMPMQSLRCHTGRNALPAGPGSGRGTRYASTHGPLPPRTGAAVLPDRPCCGQARAALTTATDLYRAMDMTFWLPQAEAALAQVA